MLRYTCMCTPGQPVSEQCKADTHGPDPAHTIMAAVSWFMIQWPRENLRPIAEQMVEMGRVIGAPKFPMFREYVTEGGGGLKRYTINDAHLVAIGSEIIARLDSAQWEEPVAVARAHMGTEASWETTPHPTPLADIRKAVAEMDKHSVPLPEMYDIPVMMNGREIGRAEITMNGQGKPVMAELNFIPVLGERRRVELLKAKAEVRKLPITELVPIGRGWDGEAVPIEEMKYQPERQRFLTFTEAKALAAESAFKMYMPGPVLAGDIVSSGAIRKATGLSMPVEPEVEPQPGTVAHVVHGRIIPNAVTDGNMVWMPATFTIHDGEVIQCVDGSGPFSTREDAEAALLKPILEPVGQDWDELIQCVDGTGAFATREAALGGTPPPLNGSVIMDPIE